MITQQIFSTRHLALSALFLLHEAQAFVAPLPSHASYLTHARSANPCNGALCLKGRLARDQPSSLRPPSSFKDGGFPLAQRSRTALAASATQTADDGITLPSYSKFLKFTVKKKEINVLFALLFFLGFFAWAILLFPGVLFAYAWVMVFDKARRRAVDWCVGLWAKGALVSMLLFPKLEGRENLPDPQEAVVYIPNHCSYLDIPVLSGTVPRKFKYVSKQEILNLPIIGWAMSMAGHIGIKRMDKRSQLMTFKETVASLNNGNSVVLFPEGTRSPDGRLKGFKKGPIKMGIKAGVRLVPVSICNLYRWMPNSAATPLAFPRGVTVKIHPAIDPAGKTEEEISDYCYNAVNMGLPEYQRTLPAAE